MVRTTVFRNNRTQAVRLPKEVALPDEVSAVDVTAVGNARVITPAGGAVDFWFDHGTRHHDRLPRRARAARTGAARPVTARFLLDTNIVIFAIRNRTSLLRERLTTRSSGWNSTSRAISVLTPWRAPPNHATLASAGLR